MSTPEENKELVRIMYKAVQEKDADTFFGNCSADLILHEAPSMEIGGTYRGMDEVGGLLGVLGELYDMPSIDIEELVADGEYVVGRASFNLSGPSGYRVTVSEWWRIIDGKVVEVRPFYWDTEELNKVIAANKK